MITTSKDGFATSRARFEYGLKDWVSGCDVDFKREITEKD